MLYLKACPRCQGDMNTNRDLYGEYKECLQCGYMVDIQKPNTLFATPIEVQPKKKKVA